MRVAILGTRGIPASYSGFETAAEQLASRLSDRGHEVVVYCRPHVVDRRLDEWRGTGRVRVVKQGPHRTVYRVTLDGLSFFVKHNRLHDLRAWVRQLVRPSKARTEYEHALAIGLPALSHHPDGSSVRIPYLDVPGTTQ